MAVVEIDLHFSDVASLKGRRHELAPIKAHLRNRLHASVAEVGGQDSWQRATLVASLVAGSPGALEEQLDGLEHWLGEHCPDGMRVRWDIRSLADLEG
ncbi:MAG: uncharacterized protein QOH64_3509 [Acidimicrobiaceae bacterium]